MSATVASLDFGLDLPSCSQSLQLLGHLRRDDRDGSTGFSQATDLPRGHRTTTKHHASLVSEQQRHGIGIAHREDTVAVM